VGGVNEGYNEEIELTAPVAGELATGAGGKLDAPRREVVYRAPGREGGSSGAGMGPRGRAGVGAWTYVCDPFADKMGIVSNLHII